MAAGRVPGKSVSSGSSATSTIIPTWALGSQQFGFLDDDNGNDSTGALQSTAAGALVTAFKTPAALHAAIPANGNGRYLTILAKPKLNGAAYPTNFIFRGKVGYKFVVIRGSHDGVNDATERRRCGSIDAISNSTTLTNYTVAAGTNAVTFTIAGSISVGVNALRGYRLRWSDTTATVELRGRMVRVRNNGTGAGASITVAYWEGTGPTPAAGDSFVIEKVGAMFPGWDIDGETMSAGRSSTQLGYMIAGLGCAGSDHVACVVIGGYCVMTFVDTASTYFRDFAGLSIQRYYIAEDDSQVDMGAGLRCTGDYQFFNVNTFLLEASDMLYTGVSHGFRRLTRCEIGGNSSTFARTPIVEGCGQENPHYPDTPLNVFGSQTGGGPFNPTLVDTGGNGGDAAMFLGCNLTCTNVQFSNLGSQGIRVSGFGCAMEFISITDGGGNALNGLDLSLLVGSRVSLGGTNSIVDIVLPASVSMKVTDLANVGFTQKTGGNTIMGAAGITSPLAVEVTNIHGSATQPGDCVYIFAADQVKKARADAAATALCDGFMVTTTANNAVGLMGPPSGAPMVVCDAFPTAGQMLYLSEVTSGALRQTAPAHAATNQILRMGRAMEGNGASVFKLLLAANIDQTPTLA